MPYPFDQIFAADPDNTEMVASNVGVLIFAPGDATKTPLTLTTLSGLPLTNPVTVNDKGFGPAFIAELDQVAWEGGGFTGLLASYKGLKDEAVAARAAADGARQAAEVSAGNAADEVSQHLAATTTAAQVAATQAQGAATSASNALAEAEAARRAAEAAAAAAANASGGAAVSPDPNNPGLYYVTAGGQLTPDPANPGLYNIGA